MTCFVDQGMNWDDLAHKRIPAPFVPKIKGELDVSNFSDEFTTMVPADSPAIVPVNSEKLFKVGTSCVTIRNRQREPSKAAEDVCV